MDNEEKILISNEEILKDICAGKSSKNVNLICPHCFRKIPVSNNILIDPKSAVCPYCSYGTIISKFEAPQAISALNKLFGKKKK